MPKLPWFPFYPADYLVDTRCLSPGARGIWMDILCLLWRAEPQGELSYEVMTWAKLLGIESDYFEHCLDEYEEFNICDISGNYEERVTLKSRRMLRDRLVRENAKIRQQKHRSHTTVTRPSQDCHRESQSQSQSQSQKEKEEEKSARSAKPTHAASSDEWLIAIKKNPAYSHIDFPVELARMDAWLAKPVNKRRKKTPTFILNWLNKIEKPIANGGGVAQPPPYPPKNDPIARGLWAKTYGDPAKWGY